jgi:hypothetical protein
VNPLPTKLKVQISSDANPLFKPPTNYHSEYVPQILYKHFFLQYNTRNRHVYICGGSQFGKSTLIERIVVSDFSTGAGVTVLDPKPQGPLAETLLKRIPADREDDVIYFNIAHPAPIDLMSWDTEQERDKLQGELFSIFTSFSETSDEDQWPNMLRAAINTLLALKAKSLLDLTKLLTNALFLKEALHKLKQLPYEEQIQQLIDYWEDQYPDRRKGAEQPILSRLNKMIFSPLANLLAYSPNAIRIKDLYRESKIFIVNLGTLSRDASNLVGRLIVSQLATAAFSQNPDHPVPHFLHADEFQNFQTSDFKTILAEAGGFHLCLCLANQGLYQITGEGIMDAVFTNANCARIAFRLNHRDISDWAHLLEGPVSIKLEADPKLEEERNLLRQQLRGLLPSTEKWYDAQNKWYEYKVTPRDLTRLSQFEAFFKLDGLPGAVKCSLPPLDPPTSEYLARAERIRAKYSRLATVRPIGTTRPVDNTSFTGTQQGLTLGDILKVKVSETIPHPRHEPISREPEGEPEPGGKTRPPHFGNPKKDKK